MEFPNSPRGWGGMAAGHGGRPISPIHRKDSGGIGTPPPSRLGGGHQTPFTPFPVRVIKFDPAKKPPRPPKPPKRVVSGKVLGGVGGKGGAGGTYSPRSSRRRKAMLFAPGLSSRGGPTRQKSTKTSKTMTTVLGVILTLLFGLLLLVQGFLVQEPPNPSLLTSDMTSSGVSPLLAPQANAFKSSGVQLEATTVQQQKAGIRLWGRRGGRSLVPKDPKSVEQRDWNRKIFRPRLPRASETASGQQQPDTVTGMEPREGGRGVAVFGSRQIDDTFSEKSGFAKEGGGEFVDTNISKASPNISTAIEDESKQEISSMGH